MLKKTEICKICDNKINEEDNIYTDISKDSGVLPNFLMNLCRSIVPFDLRAFLMPSKPLGNNSAVVKGFVIIDLNFADFLFPLCFLLGINTINTLVYKKLCVSNMRYNSTYTGVKDNKLGEIR